MLEAHFFIEADRLTVLLIYVGCQFRMKCKGVAYPCGTNSSSSICGIDEQRLHVAIDNQHEGQRIIVSIHGKPKRRLGQKAAHHFFDGKAIFG